MGLSSELKKKRTGIVITGGETPSYSSCAEYFKGDYFLVAADSGLESALDYGVRPNLVVGDMDSLGDRSLLDTFSWKQIKELPPDKDFSDTELALRELEGFDRKILIGGGGGRLDHTLALLSLFEGDNKPDLWLTGREKIFLLEDSAVIEGIKGDLISFYPLSDRNIYYKTEGLKWPLQKVNWQKGELSLSNRFSREKIIMTRGQGKLLVIHSLTTQA